MKALLVLSTLILTQACDQPVRTRVEGSSGTVSTTDSTAQCQGGYVTASDGKVVCSDNIDGASPTTPTTPTNDDDGVTSESGFETCNLNYQYYGTSIGSFALCQNSQNESSFKLKMEQTDTNTGTCFVPINIQSGGNSFSLGIAECVHNQANKVYSMTLSKTRAESINGVMVIKSNALNSYMQCMSAKTDYLNAYPGCQYDSNCTQAATNYANSVCTNFVQNYSAYYKQVNL
jgi:hypothetical protein